MKRSKYGSIPTTVDGIRFDSLGEAKYYGTLKYRAILGEIAGLRLQVKFPLHVRDKLICTYIADFVYTENGRQVVDDYKGVRTPTFNLKAKLFEAIYGFPIRISGKSKKVTKLPPAHAIGYRPDLTVKPKRRKGVTSD